MRMFLVRHGETPWNIEGRYQGRTDTPLAASGRAQAQRLGERLAEVPFSYAVASPLQRARDTAMAILAVNRGTPAPILAIDPDLIEISHGAWEGALASDVERDSPEMLHAWRHRPSRDQAAGPGAESLADVGARAARAIAAACLAAGDGNILVAAHDAVNRVILCDALGLSYQHVWQFDQAPATLNVLRRTAGGQWIVVRLNDATHVCAVDTDRLHAAI